MMNVYRSFTILIAALALAGAGPDNFTRDELLRLEAEKQTAEAKLAALEAVETGTNLDLAKLDAELIAAAQESRRREEQATAAESKLRDLHARVMAATEELYADEDVLEDLLAALVSAGRARPPALIVSPNAANQSVRAALLMGDAAPQLSAKATTLKDEIETLNRLDRGIRREQAKLAAAKAVLALKREEIAQLAIHKRAQFENITEDTKSLRATVQKLGAEAQTLRELLSKLETNAPTRPRRKPDAPKQYAALDPRTGANPAPNARRQIALRPLGTESLGALIQPVSGLIVEGFGQRRASGEQAKGIKVATRPEAQIVAPVDGVIEYAGTFRSYGQALILRTSDDYYVFLSGFGLIYGAPKQQVKAGEPIGRMSNRVNPPPQLYFELIKNDKSIDPARWIKRGG